MGITTLSVDDETKERFDDARPEGCRSAGEFVNMLLDAWEDRDDDIPEGLEYVAYEASEDELEAIRERIERIPERTADELEGRLR